MGCSVSSSDKTIEILNSSVHVKIGKKYEKIS